MPGSSTPPRDATERSHHAAVLAQQPVTMWSPPDVFVDFIGSKTRRSYEVGMAVEREDAPVAQVVTPSYPLFNDEYFEWIDVLETVEAAIDTYVMVELGAGYGRWSVRAALAAARKPSCTFHCVAVEAEPMHFRWMVDHFRDNGLNPDDHDVIWAAVGTEPGFVPFRIGNADSWYGQAIAARPEDPLPAARTRRRLKARSILGRPPIMSATESRMWVPCVTVSELLAPYSEIDLIHMDVQGSEFDALAPAIALLNERVRRIHVGTHSTQIEESLRKLFSAAGWQKLNDYPCHSRVPTPYGDITFGDGVQTWLNPGRRSSRHVHAPAGPETVRPSTESQALIAVLQERVEGLQERNLGLKAEIARLREKHRESRTNRERETAPPSAESPELVAALHARVADLKERNRQLKAETVRLREQHRASRAHGQPKAVPRWWKRLVPGWLSRLRHGSARFR
jgi:FkbM family methyltransferase